MRRRGRAGTDPNAPFVLIDRTPRPTAHLASMSAQDASPCSAREISLEEVAAEMNGQSREVKFAFVNEGATPCRIGGYPGIALLDAQNLPVANLTVVKSAPGTLEAHTVPASASAQITREALELVLDPRQEAYFGITWTTGENCPAVSRIELTAPGTSQTFTISRPLTVCAGEVKVTALQSTQDAS